MLKKISIILAVLILLSVVGVKLLVSHFLSRDFIVAEIEKEIPARVEIRDIDISIFKPSAKISLRGVSVSSPDSLVTDKVKHDDRPKMVNPQLKIENTQLEVSLMDLLSKKLVVKSILIDEMYADVTVHKNGSTSLEQLFIKPDPTKKNPKTTKTTANPKSNPKSKIAPQPSPSKAENKPTTSSTTSLEGSLQDFEIRNAQLNVVLASAALKLKATSLDLKLIDGVDFSLEELVKVSSTAFETNGDFELYSRDEKSHYGKVMLSGNVVGEFLNPANAQFQPECTLVVELMDGSYLHQIPVLDKLVSRFVKSTNIPIIGKYMENNWEKDYVFGKGQELRLQVQNTRYTLLAPLKLQADGWVIQVNKGSWLNSANSQHVFGYKIIANRSTSELIQKGMNGVIKNIPERYVQKTNTKIQKLFNEKGRFFVSLRTTGDIAKPVVEELTKIPTKEDFTQQIKDGLQNKLKKEIDRELEKNLDKLDDKVNDKIRGFLDKL
ncbi:AsmA family protein [Akkermansiaceae bacterium]|nr:AsmA family protein [Akkermansiaceae bacterium]